MFSLKDKVAVVTGASQGIGREAALALAEAGAKVAVAARNEEKLAALVKDIAAVGGEAFAVKMDVADAEQVKVGFKQVVAVRVQDMRLIGFVTTEDVRGLPPSPEGEKLVAVYLPMSYGIGGYTVYLPKALVEPLDMSLEDAMRLTLIGGVSAKETGRK